jgi:hypothetical protein
LRGAPPAAPPHFSWRAPSWVLPCRPRLRLAAPHICRPTAPLARRSRMAGPARRRARAPRRRAAPRAPATPHAQTQFPARGPARARAGPTLASAAPLAQPHAPVPGARPPDRARRRALLPASKTPHDNPTPRPWDELEPSDSRETRPSVAICSARARRRMPWAACAAPLPGPPPAPPRRPTLRGPARRARPAAACTCTTPAPTTPMGGVGGGGGTLGAPGGPPRRSPCGAPRGCCLRPRSGRRAPAVWLAPHIAPPRRSAAKPFAARAPKRRQRAPYAPLPTQIRRGRGGAPAWTPAAATAPRQTLLGRPSI